ncbi:MAG: response regulator [Phycisphaerales bacterium]|nr:response regulator [Phycisphaerales bacterium]
MPGQSRKILVVDDETHIVHVVSLKLRNAGFEVLTAADGEEAYEVACAELPDVVITDFQMPYMTGLELCVALRDNAETAHIPILMLTARGHAIDESELAKTNILGVLSKPFSPREVLMRVTELLGQDGAGTASEAEAA